MTSGEREGSRRDAHSAVSWLTLANALTALRALLVPVMVSCLLRGEAALALGAFVVAVITDFFDGRVARKRDEATPFGGFFDHATDAVFVAAGLGALAYMGMAPVYLPPLLLAAFVQYTLDSKALAGRPLRSSLLGRWNGIAYYVALGTPVVRDGLGLGWPPDEWVIGLGWLLVASTVVSMGDRALALLRNVSEGD